MLKKSLLCFVAASCVATILAGNGFADVVFSYSSTPDDETMSMPSEQGWTEVGTWDAGDEAVYAEAVDPDPGYVAHNLTLVDAPGYIYQALDAAQEADALAYGWTLNLQARFYQTWGTGFETTGTLLGFGVKTSAGTTVVSHTLERDEVPNYSNAVALIGDDGTGLGYDYVATPRVNDGSGETPLMPTYMNYTLSYDPASGEVTLAVTDAYGIGFTLGNTLLSDTALSATGLDPASLPSMVYIGDPTGTTSGHTYIDSLTFDINGGSPDLIPGDANGDKKVDGSDVTILAGNWQVGVDGTQSATWEMGDFNGDHKVDGSDVTILAGNWQYGVTAAASAVPEPSMLAMLLALAGGFLCRRRR